MNGNPTGERRERTKPEIETKRTSIIKEDEKTKAKKTKTVTQKPGQTEVSKTTHCPKARKTRW
jgi:hypothetical protein